MKEEKLMSRVQILLADDEPFILKGLQMLIDWELYGCEIAATASNGLEAYNIIKSQKIDLAIVDIRMPELTGLELISRVKEEGTADTDFVVLSGFSDFEYAQTALRLGVVDYLLKPVSQKQLVTLLRKIGVKKDADNVMQEHTEKLRRACLVQYILAILNGKSNQHQIDYVRENLAVGGDLNFIHITLENVASLEEMTDEEVAEIKKKIIENCSEYLGKYSDHLLPEAEGFEEDYEIGFLYSSEMAKEAGKTDREFLEEFRKAAMRNIPIEVVLLVGRTVSETEKLATSYSAACELRYFRSFQKGGGVYSYDDEMYVPHSQAKMMIHKDAADDLVNAVIKHDHDEICECVDKLFENMENAHFNRFLNLNVNYFLFRMIHLAVEIDETVEQDNILLYISDDVFVPGKNFKEHFKNFALEYSDYLTQLKKNSGHRGLKDVERYIQEHYAENLTLRDLGKMYYINSSYLGQLFHKKYGISFKDYLNNCRINAAAEMLLKSDRKVADIAAEVGYKDIDYFVSKFIEINGCTPTKYRRNI